MVYNYFCSAGVLELADEADSKSVGVTPVRVRPPPPAPEKNPHLSTTSVGSFQLNPPYRVGEIIFDDEIPYGDEIRLDGGWVDLISSAKQISSEFARISSRLRGFIEISEDLRYNQLTNKNMLHTSLLQRKGDNNEIIIYDR